MNLSFWNYEISRGGKVFRNGVEMNQSMIGEYKRVALKNPFENKFKSFLVHRLVAFLYVPNPAPSIFRCVDHIDGTKNNHYTNLRWVNHHLNSINRTSARGCYFVKRWKKWRARLCGKNLGYYRTEKAAHSAYKRAQQEYFNTTYQRYLDAESSTPADDSTNIQTTEESSFRRYPSYYT